MTAILHQQQHEGTAAPRPKPKSHLAPYRVQIRHDNVSIILFDNSLTVLPLSI